MLPVARLVPFRYHWYEGEAPPFTGVGVKTTFVPAHIVLPGDAAIDTAGVTGGVSERLPKFGAPDPGTMPAMVPPVMDVQVILPAADAPDVACTCNPSICTWSYPSMPLTVTFIVRVVLVMLPVTEVTFEPVVKPKVGSEAELNCQPAGAVSTTTSVAGPKISAVFPSRMVIIPNVVYPGAVPPSALLLHMDVPPLAGVTVTAAYPEPQMQQRITSNKVFIALIRPSLPVTTAKNDRKEIFLMNKSVKPKH